jgi:hypothetical protein
MHRKGRAERHAKSRKRKGVVLEVGRELGERVCDNCGD